METYSYQKTLPCCTLNKSLLAEIEKRLLYGIPKLLQPLLAKVVQGLGLKDHKKLEKYQIVVEARQGARTLPSAQQLSTSYFESRTRQVSIVYTLGAPKIICVEISFPQNARPCIKMTTQSPQIEKLLAGIAEGLCLSIPRYANRHKLLHNSFVQALLLLTVPALVMGYGCYSGIDFFLLYTSMGWLCLLSLGLVKALPLMFPWVTFESKSRFQLNRLPLLAKFSLLSVCVGCYISLVLLSLPRASAPITVMLAGIIG